MTNRIVKLEVHTDGAQTHRFGKTAHVYAFVVYKFDKLTFDRFDAVEIYRESGAQIEPRSHRTYCEFLAFSKAVDYVARILDSTPYPVKVEFYSDYTPLIHLLNGAQTIRRARAKYILDIMRRPQSILKRFNDVSYFRVDRFRIREADLLARAERRHQEQLAAARADIPQPPAFYGN